jgi:hypothetical protein
MASYILPKPRIVRRNGNVSRFYDLPADKIDPETAYAVGPVAAVELWYNRYERSWVAMKVTREGYQVGASEYEGSREGGDVSVAYFLRELGVEVPVR